ncbi:hypothetical protein [Gulosibacter hominis]|uniref:hypothetical protein n=1 Tax=Gulosibacter hominis TaxID=2770504 RepID=UPI00191B4EFD|nr:hypothetical protein [Gulosibacter hominis]
MNSLTFPLPTSTPTQIIPATTEARPVMKYVDGKRTDTPETNSKGEPLYAFDAMLHHASLPEAIPTVRIKTPTQHLPKVEFGGVLTLKDAVLTVRNNNGGFNLAVSVEATAVVGGAPLPTPKND